MISVIIPAHNEEPVIERGLRSLTQGAARSELEVIVACNGCNDKTAQIARQFGSPVRVIETEIASKANALNLGDMSASGFPRLYMDADVVMTIGSIREIVKALEVKGVLAAAPAVRTVFLAETSWAVRAYYEFWMALPYVQEGMMAAGAYAVNREGRKRFGSFPDVIADDGYFRLQFGPTERVEVRNAVSTVYARQTLGLGSYQDSQQAGFLSNARAISPNCGVAMRRRSSMEAALATVWRGGRESGFLRTAIPVG